MKRDFKGVNEIGDADGVGTVRARESWKAGLARRHHHRVTHVGTCFQTDRVHALQTC